jgi:hypothetical protein
MNLTGAANIDDQVLNFKFNVKQETPAQIVNELIDQNFNFAVYEQKLILDKLNHVV